MRPRTALFRVAVIAALGAWAFLNWPGNHWGDDSAPVSGEAGEGLPLWTVYSTQENGRITDDERSAILESGQPTETRSAFSTGNWNDILPKLQSGSEIRIPLPGEVEVTGRVNLVLRDEAGTVRVGGSLTGSRLGSFAFHWVEGRLNGRVLIPEEAVGFLISTPDTGLGIASRDLRIAEILCFPMPREPAGLPDATALGGPLVPLAAPPLLSSRPEATAVVFLDFDGATVTDPDWNGGATIVAAPSVLDEAGITAVWNRVKEDFFPFAIDVTTDPVRYDSAPVGQRMRVIVTPTDTAGPDTGGVAYLESLATAGLYFSDNVPAWVFNQSIVGAAEAISHEVGHTLGLKHDGRATAEGFFEEYYEGHGSGPTSWAPIMGFGIGRNVVQWSKGEYLDANNPEDDLAIIAGNQSMPLSGLTNPFGYVPNDEGNDRAHATIVTIVPGEPQRFPGLVFTSSDIDFFRFAVPANSGIAFNVRPAAIAPNLDVRAELLNSSGTVLLTSGQDGRLDAQGFYSATTAGSYYLSVRGSGTGDPVLGGYSNYGSIGPYEVEILIVPSPEKPKIAMQPSSQVARVGESATFSVLADGTPPFAYQWRRNGVAIAGEIGSTFSLVSVQESDVADYDVVVTNTAGEVVSAKVRLFVPTTPIVATWPAGRSVLRGHEAHLVVSALGSDPFEFQWYRNGRPIEGANGAELSIGSMTIADVGAYSVSITGLRGTVPAASGRIISASSHNLYIREDGTMWSNGWNYFGQLGDGRMDNRSVPAPVADGVVEVSAGGSHSLYLTRDGQLWGMGFNAYGQLGFENPPDVGNPVQVTARLVASDVRAFSAGVWQSFFVKSDGSLWATGYNQDGQLGDGTKDNRSTPVKVADEVASVAASGGHTLFIKFDGSIWGMGRNTSGQLGDGTTTSRWRPVPIAEGVIAAAVGSGHSLFLKADGTLWAMGSNEYGQLGDGTQTRRNIPVQVASGVVAIDAGGWHTLVLKADATLWATGHNSDGQLGDGTTTDRLVLERVANDVTAMSAGVFHSIFLKQDGSLWGMGRNELGVLGEVAEGIQATPVQLADGIPPSAFLGIEYPPRTLLGLATRGFVGTGEKLMIMGFVIDGDAPKRMILRGLGPTLASSGVAGTLENPRLELYRGDTLIGLNDNWVNTPSQVSQMAEAGLVVPESWLEAVLIVTLDPGVYTVHLSGVGGGSGVGMLETYDGDPADPPPASRLYAISTRGYMNTGDGVLIGGLALSGSAPVQVLVQAVGPSLAGVPGLLSDPGVRIVKGDGSSAVIAENDDWESGNDTGGMMAARARSGATPLAEGARDASVLIMLEPGLYTAVSYGNAEGTGVALMNIYEVPPE